MAMGSLIASIDPGVQLVADTSTIINLIATECARPVISALPNRLVVVDVVPSELKTGHAHGRDTWDKLNELVRDDIVGTVALDEGVAPHFEDLVVGPATETLDDGEAATIAYALKHAGTALLDDRKAIRICAERFPQLSVACTVDLLGHPDVRRQLGPERVADAIFNALSGARMGVLPHQLEWIVGVIGDERTALCPSLPRRVRRPR